MVRPRSKDIGFALSIVILMLLVNGCVKHDLEPPITVDCTDFRTVSFATDVQPIIGANCAIPSSTMATMEPILIGQIPSNFKIILVKPDEGLCYLKPAQIICPE